MQQTQPGGFSDFSRRIDTSAALWLLASLAGLHRQPFDAALVTKGFPPPFDLPTLFGALQAIGLQAGQVGWPEVGRGDLPLPAVALLELPVAPDAAEESVVPASQARSTLVPALIVSYGEETLSWVKPGQSEPEVLSHDMA